MSQPAFVPITTADQVRPTIPQPVPTHLAGRPGEDRCVEAPEGRRFGSPGPDQGYALRLAHRIVERCHLFDGEQAHDVEVGAALLAARRAGDAGRAPSIHDLEAVLGLFGFLDPAPPAELIAHRRWAFASVGHSYATQRALVGSVSAAALQLSPDAAAAAAKDWRSFIS